MNQGSNGNQRSCGQNNAKQGQEAAEFVLA
jgi:hypothetical protein